MLELTRGRAIFCPRGSLVRFEAPSQGYLRVRISWFREGGWVLSHSRLEFCPRSQDPLHLVPRDMSVGPEQSSDPKWFEETRTNKALPLRQTTRVRKSLGRNQCYSSRFRELGGPLNVHSSTDQGRYGIVGRRGRVGSEVPIDASSKRIPSTGRGQKKD